jgi:hypothetical protein
MPSLIERIGGPDTELLTFSDTEALHALAVITERRPKVVALERLYAATSRGAALINRIKADPTLNSSEIRIIAHNSDYMRISPRKAAAPIRAVAPPQPLDQRGTRRAPRFKIAPPAHALTDGNAATIVDLSIVGAQVVSAAVLRPGQRVRVELLDDQGVLQFAALVVWASFESTPDTGPRYRVGLEFSNANAPAVGAYCERHKI